MCHVPLQYYRQVNISEWCKGRKNRGHLHSSDFIIKWELLPSFNPSLPLFPYFLTSFPASPRSPLAWYLSPSLHLPSSIFHSAHGPTVQPPRCIPLPRKKELNILHNSSTLSQRWLSKKDTNWLWVTVYLQLQPALFTIGCSKWTNHCTFEYSGRLPVAFLTILNPFHSIWEMLAVVSRSLSPHTTATATPQKRKSPTLFKTLIILVSPDTVSLFFLSFALFLSAWFGVLAASREQRTRGVRRKHRLLPQMLRGEWMWVLGCSKALPPTTLPPCPPLPPPLPTTTCPVACSAGRSEPAHTPPPPQLSFRVCDWLLGLPVSPWPHLPSLSVNTFALWLALSPRRHTPTAARFGREKALWIPAKQSIAAEVCLCLSEQRRAELLQPQALW